MDFSRVSWPGSSQEYTEMYASLFQQTMSTRFGDAQSTDSADGTTTSETTAPSDKQIADVAAEVEEKIQNIFEEKYDTFIKEDDINQKEEEEKISSDSKKSDIEYDTELLEEYMKLTMPEEESQEAKEILDEVNSIKYENVTIQNYSAPLSAMSFNGKIFQERIDETKDEIKTFKESEEAKQKEENEKSIIEDKNKEINIDDYNNVFDTENLFKRR